MYSKKLLALYGLLILVIFLIPIIPQREPQHVTPIQETKLPTIPARLEFWDLIPTIENWLKQLALNTPTLLQREWGDFTQRVGDFQFLPSVYANGTITSDQTCNSQSVNSTSCVLTSMATNALVVLVEVTQDSTPTGTPTACGNNMTNYETLANIENNLSMYIWDYYFTGASGNCTVASDTFNTGCGDNCVVILAADFTGTASASPFFETEVKGGAASQGQTYNQSLSISAGTYGRWELMMNGASQVTSNTTATSWASFGSGQVDIQQLTHSTKWVGADMNYKISSIADTLTDTVTATNQASNMGVYGVAVGIIPKPAIIRVQEVPGSWSSGTTFTVTMGALTNGNSELCTIGLSSSGSGAARTVSSIAQTGGTWTETAAHATNTTGSGGSKKGIESSIWNALNISGASTTITITISSATGMNSGWAACSEYSGMLTSNPVDVTATNTGTASPVDSGTTGATAQADELLVASLSGYVNAAWGTPTNSFANIDSVGTTLLSSMFAQKNVGTETTSTTNASLTTPVVWVGATATFKASVTEPVRIQGNKRGTWSSGTSFTVTVTAPTNTNAMICSLGGDNVVLITVSSITETGATWAVQKTQSTSVLDSEIWAAFNV